MQVVSSARLLRSSHVPHTWSPGSQNAFYCHCCPKATSTVSRFWVPGLLLRILDYNSNVKFARTLPRLPRPRSTLGGGHRYVVCSPCSTHDVSLANTDTRRAAGTVLWSNVMLPRADITPGAQQLRLQISLTKDQTKTQTLGQDPACLWSLRR